MAISMVQRRWEFWPFWLRYLPLVPLWLWYCIRARSVWFFSAANPTLTFSGFEGEPKKEMYDQLPPNSFPHTIYIQPGCSTEMLLALVTENNFTYPFIVKPDVGMSGILFRKIYTEKQLLQYHRQMPVQYLVQALVPYAVEYSVFYYRIPGETKGCITGFLQKEPLSVIGDGNKTLWQLMQAHPVAATRTEELRVQHSTKLDVVLPAGQKLFLTDAANLSRGGRFINLHQQIDADLHAVFDELNNASEHFYYGRYDLKAASVADLKNGTNFSILEFNGAGAEPNHVYFSGYSWWQALAEIAKHWKILFSISRKMHAQGTEYWTFLKGWRFLQAAKRHFFLLKKVDNRIILND